MPKLNTIASQVMLSTMGRSDMSVTPKYAEAEFIGTPLEGHLISTWHHDIGYPTGLALTYETTSKELGSDFVWILEILFEKGYSLTEVDLDDEIIAGELIIRKE